MSVVRADRAVLFEAHGSRFHSYVAPSRGSRQLCAWRLEVPAGLRGVPHRPTREEVLLVLTGELTATVDGSPATLGPGDVLVVPAGSEFAVDAGPVGCTAWVTTSPGLEAVLPDGTRLAPPWAA
ncbi:cupin domain-containing protein [Trujillonella endophytica]|uniref:Cupin domain-containing protein n=1 Tax=Trujillonella endophytica TaxID=673521 RepID=A0A1H8PE39_9ACTN|nr:cupin domain-containing protein [Trujillella endophytica]SEO39908.1 Cupin domain-containing protein [Trujillella endophytica]